MIVIVLLVLIGGTVLVYTCDDEPLGKVAGVILIFMSGIFFLRILSSNTPTAIDVYRGKTTLQITYQDSIPTDTVVVFKE